MISDSRLASLRAVKIVHTVVWACLAGCIFAIPICASTRRFRAAFILIAIILAESMVLVVNGWRCPLTDVAARYTDDRRDNFDIYLPEWFARHNKVIFGLLYIGGILITIGQWVHWLSPLR